MQRPSGQKTEKLLRSRKGNAFNTAYIDNEVAYHKAVIGAVGGLLIPETENAELEALSRNVVPQNNGLIKWIVVQKSIPSNLVVLCVL